MQFAREVSSRVHGSGVILEEGMPGQIFGSPEQERTGEIEAFCRGKGIDTVFRSDPGGHAKNLVGRTAAGIVWILGWQRPDR